MSWPPPARWTIDFIHQILRSESNRTDAVVLRMSSKKRKGYSRANPTAKVAQKASRNAESSHPLPEIDDLGDESDLATMRMQRDQARAELAAALLRNEQFEAAAAEPCARCHFYSDWTVRVRTMGGQVHTIACPDGPKTLVAHVKQKLAPFDPKYHILQQLTLVVPCEASSSCCSSSSADLTESTLSDDRTLASYGLSKRDALDLFLVDMNWNNECRAMIEFIKDCGKEIIFENVKDDDLALAVSWALVNAVCFVATVLITSLEI